MPELTLQRELGCRACPGDGVGAWGGGRAIANILPRTYAEVYLNKMILKYTKPYPLYFRNTQPCRDPAVGVRNGEEAEVPASN